MRKKQIVQTAVVIILVVAAVSFIWIMALAYLGSVGSIDYWAVYRPFNSISKVDNSKIAYEMPYVHGYPDQDVSFTDCAFSFEVNGTSLPPMNVHLTNNNSMDGPYWQADAQLSNGAGPFNSVTFLQDTISYNVTIMDVNNDGRVNDGDLVTVNCTQPLAPDTSYLLNVFVDIDGTWGIGRVFGAFHN